MEYFIPKPDYRRSNEWMWPYLDFDMDAEDLFTTLHDRFNTHAMPLQTPRSFYNDVCEVSRQAKSREELYSLLEERKNQRIKEMNKAWNDIGSFISLKPRLMGCPICYDNHAMDENIPPDSLNDSVVKRWHTAFDVMKFSSFDTLIAYFDGFVRDDRKQRDDLRRDMDERWARLREKRRKREVIASSAFEEGTEEATEEALRHKRRRTMSESDGDDDTLKPAAQQYQWEATEPTAPTSKQVEKRKQPSDLHEQDGARSKRPKLYHSTDPVDQGPSMFAASCYSPSNPLGGLNHSHSSTFSESYSPNNPLGGLSHSYPRRDEDKSGWASAIPQSPPFDYSEMFYIRRLPPREIEELPDTDPPVYTADTKRSREPLRANGRQPVDKGLSREEPETSSSQKQQPSQDNPSQEQPPQKKPPQKKRRERKTSPTIERVLRSRRSSRRGTRQDLLFLGDDATPHVASRKRKF
ncbi:uncharacterized protein TRIVIDRAFT_60955 [Trichoderma virens Gv29-8]|uniref:Uncharacterized protein n=1 Tax=Hypocrea virens (strain Gv29-8 / FGSC 10586) TaxID=413071 RepID=G9MSF4_HYPVG|nr:uncharacterized protein TRIVIDRAFT_60955 [Trichoderma virens Gv29-8]EHK22170.1 hypothetical protein TRIVIDRAFT_60955 [Trichoderma virens Gv29-8]UKZ47206.1 hypothetical protein TrVGV298_001421 [Trichoderma virens]